MTDSRIHHGCNIKKMRELLDIKQEDLADQLGEDWSQKKISQLESKELVDDTILEQVSKILGVPQQTLKNLDLPDAIVNIQNNYEGTNNQGTQIVNPTDEWMKSVAEIQRLNEENKKLYERLLATEREKNELLQQMLDKNK